MGGVGEGCELYEGQKGRATRKMTAASFEEMVLDGGLCWRVATGLLKLMEVSERELPANAACKKQGSKEVLLSVNRG